MNVIFEEASRICRILRNLEKVRLDARLGQIVIYMHLNTISKEKKTKKIRQNGPIEFQITGECHRLLQFTWIYRGPNVH